MLNKSGLIGTALISFLLLAARQPANSVIKLVIQHDGKEERAPDHVTLIFDKHSVQMPIQDGRFEVPPEFLSADKFTFTIDLEGEHISVSDLSGTRFMAGDWKLLLAERHYGDEYQRAVPKGAVVRRSCILVFESPDTDPGTFVFCRNCRSKHN